MQQNYHSSNPWGLPLPTIDLSPFLQALINREIYILLCLSRYATYTVKLQFNEIPRGNLINPSGFCRPHGHI